MQCEGCQGADGWVSSPIPTLSGNRSLAYVPITKTSVLKNVQVTVTQAKVDDMILKGCQHLASNFTQGGGNKYKALRYYNSGSIAASGDLSDPKSVGTPSYVSDVANRLHGWANWEGRDAFHSSAWRTDPMTGASTRPKPLKVWTFQEKKDFFQSTCTLYIVFLMSIDIG